MPRSLTTTRSVAEHLGAVLSSIAVLPGVRLSLDDARGRVLAEDVVTRTDTPPFDNSAMDGYAVRRADLLAASATTPVCLTVIADLPAGTAENPRIGAGQAARIMTGAPIPDGADAVVPIEHTDEGTEIVAVRSAPHVAAHIRRAGGDARAGDTVLQAGSVLWPARIAAAASAGTGTVAAHPSPRVAVISTGSELVSPGSATRRGQIPDSNSFLLAAAVAEAGGVSVRIGAVPDDEHTLRELLARLTPDVDVIVLSGGVSVGAFDVVKAVLAPLDTMAFGSIRMQPGKPQGFGSLPGGPAVFALPGNPVSAYVSFEVFVRPALRLMAGHVALHRPTLTGIADDAWPSAPGRTQYMPVVIDGVGGRDRPSVRRATSGGSASHLVAGLAQATGLAVIPEHISGVHVGDSLTVMVTT